MKYTSLPKAQQRYGVSRSTMYGLIAAEKLIAVKCGTRVLVDIEHADAYFASLPRPDLHCYPKAA